MFIVKKQQTLCIFLSPVQLPPRFSPVFLSVYYYGLRDLNTGVKTNEQTVSEKSVNVAVSKFGQH